MNRLHQPIGKSACVVFVAAAIAAALAFISLGNDRYLGDLPRSTSVSSYRDRGGQADTSLLDALQPTVAAYEACDDTSSGKRHVPGAEPAEPCQSGTLLEQLILLILR